MIDILDDQDSPDALHGAYTYEFARATLGGYRLRTAVEAGELIGFGRGVLLDARRVFDLRTRCAGAQLLTDGVLTGPTAAALHGCTAAGGFPVHVRVPYARRMRSRDGLVVHQGETPPDDTTILDGLRVLTADLAVSEVLCAAPRRTALACADELLRGIRPDDRPDVTASIAARLADRTDRRGTRRALALLALATGRPRSPAQSAFLLVLADAGFPRPACQYEIHDANGRVRHRLDFAWPDRRIALEHDDDHTGPPDEHLRHRGWQIIRADTQDLADPTALCRRLRAAFQPQHQAA
jgi:hypothetical protein